MGKELQDELGIEIISPLHDEYNLFTPAKCNQYSINQTGNLIVKIDDDPILTSELRLYLQVNKYIQEKSNASASANLKQILSAKADENRERKTRLIAMADDLLSKAQFHALGTRVDIQGSTTPKAITDGLDYLVKNIFSKFNYLTSVSSDPISEIKQILQSDDVAQHQLSLALKEKEPADIKEVMVYIKMKTAINHPVILEEVVRQFSKRPYGWGEFQVVILIAKIFMAGTISLVVDGAKVKPKEAFSPLTKTHQWKTVKIIETPLIDKNALDNAKALAKELFGSIPPDSQDKLSQFILEGLSTWVQTLEKYKPLADTGNYPGKKEIDSCLDITADIIRIHGVFEIIKAFIAKKDDLKDAADDLHTLNDFYAHQRSTWDKLRASMKTVMPNKSALNKHRDAERALKRMIEIIQAPNPYGMLKEVDGLISVVESINTELLKKSREEAENELEIKISQLKARLDDHHADANFQNSILSPIQQIKKKIETESSIPEISYKTSESLEAYEEAIGKIEDTFLPPEKDAVKPTKIIKAASLVQKGYLESETDAADYVDKIRKAIVDAINENYRVKIS
jgi:hypothetical protein